MSEKFNYKSHEERAVAALIDLLDMAKEELNTNRWPSLLDTRIVTTMAIAAIHSLLGDHESARKYLAMHLDWLNRRYPGANLDPSFDAIYRLYGDSHGLPYGDAIRERALDRQEALANGKPHRDDPMVFGLGLLVCVQDHDANRLLVAILVTLRICLSLFKPHELDYRETIQFMIELLGKIAAKTGLNAEELTNHVLWHMNQQQSEFIEELAAIMREAPYLFEAHYPPNSELLLERPEAQFLKEGMSDVRDISN